MDPNAETVAGDLVEHEPTHRAGDRVGHYELVRMLGEGGMGEVWEGQHVEIGKRVAVKFLFPKLAADPTFVERFRREAMATANLDHVNICRALDFRNEADETFLVLDFVEGRSLAEMIEDYAKLPVGDVVEIALSICSGLQAAHDEGVVHRDLKPENVMVPSDDFSNLKILDFGIASSYGTPENERLTHTGQAIGTPVYMSPEQIAARQIEPPSDQYALGVLLFELLAGRPPFQSDVAFEILEAHVRRPPPDVREFRPDVPPDIAAVISKLLSKSPDDRYSSVSEVAVALQRADRSIVVARSESSHGIKKQHAIIGAAVVFVALVSLGLAAIYSITIGDEETQQQIATQKRQSFLEDRREALALFDTTTLESIEKQLLTHDDPHLRSAHGSALIDAGMVPEALDAYAAAAKRDPRYLGFDPLIEAFKSCMTAKGCASLDARGWDLSDSNASNFREELFEIAVTGKSTQRKLATSVLEDFGGLSELATWQRDAMTLVNGTGCEERTKAIGRLADEKNDRATAILREMQERPKRGCGLLNLKDCISCLRDPLDKALAK